MFFLKKEMVRRDTDWDGLTGWPLQLFIIKTMASVRMPETGGKELRNISHSKNNNL